MNIAKGLLKLLMAKDLLGWVFATDLMGLLIAKDLLEFILTLALTELFTLTFCRGSGASFQTPQKKDGGLLPKILICLVFYWPEVPLELVSQDV